MPPFHAGQYVRITTGKKKVDVGQIQEIDHAKAVVATMSGFNVVCKPDQLARATLVILDLNGVLGFRKSSKNFRKRPHVDAFLSFVFKNFVVGVWSSCVEANGRSIIEQVFGDFEPRLLFRMFRDECTPAPTATNRYGTVKDLRRVWDRYSSSFDHRNTIIVDDSDAKCSHRQNALCPTPYEGKETEHDLEQGEDGTKGDRVGLPEIVTVLSEVIKVGSLDPLRLLMFQKHLRENSGGSNESSPLKPPPTTEQQQAGGHSPPAFDNSDPRRSSSQPSPAPMAPQHHPVDHHARQKQQSAMGSADHSRYPTTDSSSALIQQLFDQRESSAMLNVARADAEEDPCVDEDRPVVGTPVQQSLSALRQLGIPCRSVSPSSMATPPQSALFVSEPQQQQQQQATRAGRIFGGLTPPAQGSCVANGQRRHHDGDLEEAA